MWILLGGLPGSGKTNLVKKIQERYKEREFIIIDTDEYRKLHPNYETLIKTPEKAIVETSEFSNAIEAELIKRAIKKINELYKLKQNQNANSIEYKSMKRLEELFGVKRDKERE